MKRSVRVLIALAFFVATPLSFTSSSRVIENRACATEGQSNGTCKFSPDEVCTVGRNSVWDYYWKD